MPSWKQGDKFTPTSGAEEVPVQQVEEPAQPEEAPKKKGVLGKVPPLVIAVVCVLLVIIGVVIFVMWEKHASNVSMQNPTTTDDPFGWVDDNPGTNPDDFLGQFDPVFSYTEEEKAQLRAWGYTGDDIEAAQLAETPAQELIDASRQAQEEARASLSNPESPEYLALLNQTWLGEQAAVAPQFVVNETQYSNETITLNADFIKVPPHGTNLFLKVQLEDGTWHWMECSPFRWGDLPDSGNIVVTYDKIIFDGHTYIINMREKEVS